MTKDKKLKNMNMKKIVLSTVFVVVSALLSMNINAQVKPTEEAIKNLKPYPEQLDSLERHVIYLEQKSDESLFEVELIVGKKMEVDCNRHRLMGNFQEETIQGWGYNYYIFDTEGHVMSTMMMCPGPKTEKFIQGESITVRYNSRLPLVIYLPQGYELRYKIWTAGEEQTAEKM